MAKKKEQLLALAPVPSLPVVSTQSNLSPFRPSSKLVSDERRMLEQLHKQTTFQQGQTIKAIYGMAKIAEIHHQGTVLFDGTVESIETIREGKQRSPQHQRYIDEFSHHTIQTCAHHFSATMEVGSYTIAQIVHQSLDVPEEKRSFWQRLFCG